MNEFDLINHYFKARASPRSDVILGIGDDCALFKPPTDHWLAFSTDTLVENIHFLPSATAQSIGHKCLAVSLSDLAAMGAEPAWVMLSLTLPEIDSSWCEAFSQGFFHLLQQYQMQLIGGNTSRGPLTITTQVCGLVPPGMALYRAGAQAHDDIYVTGCIGDAALALQCLQNKITLPNAVLSEAQTRLDYPKPQIAAGIALRSIATAMIDLSDGLTADLNHLLTQSQVGATLVVEDLPLSKGLQAVSPELAYSLALTGGDDYELCFTAPQEKRAQITELTMQQIHCYRIGMIETSPGLRVRYADGKPFHLQRKGFMQF